MPSKFSAPLYTLNRRAFVMSGLAAATLPWQARADSLVVKSRSGATDHPFALGVASGDPTPNSVILWTRLAPEPLEADGGMPSENVEVHWVVAEDERFEKVVRKGTQVATPSFAHAVHAEVLGLQPDRWYFYRFFTKDAESPVGRTRTMPRYDAMPEKLRFAFASCQHYETGLYTAYEHMAQEDLDLIAHLGDYIYEYPGADNRVRKHAGPKTTKLLTIDDYRIRHAQYKTDEHLQAAHAICPWVVTWDDHEFDNNYADDISEVAGVDPVKFLKQRANAYRAYYEHMPVGPMSIPQGPYMRLYKNVDFGRLARFSVLDTRQYRTDQPCGDGNKPPCDEVFDREATLLGDDQEQWLNDSLVNSPSRWNVLTQQIMMARVDRANGETVAFSMDQWGGYDVARRRLLSFFKEREISNPVVITGDIHTNWVNDLKVDFDDPDSPTVATEFVGTSISSGGNGSQTRGDTQGVLDENPFVKFYNAERGYVSCTLTPKEYRSDYQVVEYVDRPGAAKITRASFVVEDGRPGAEKA